MPDEYVVKTRATGDMSDCIVIKGTGQRDDIRVVATGATKIPENILSAASQKEIRRIVVKGAPQSDLFEGVSREEIARLVRRMTGADVIEATQRRYATAQQLAASFAGAELAAEATRVRLQAADAQRTAASVLTQATQDAASAATLLMGDYEQAARKAITASSFASEQIARLQAIQTLPEQILAQFSPLSARLLADVKTATERMLESPHLRRLRAEEDEWQWFLQDLEMSYRGLDRKKVLALLPDPLGPMTSLVRLDRATKAVRAIEQLQDAWHGDDEKRDRVLRKWLKDAVRERAAARREAKAARFLPGTTGLRLSIPKGDETWADTMRRDPRWRNPTRWPWLGDRAFDVATLLRRYVTAERSRDRRGAKGRQGRPMAKKILELTAEVMNRWYRRHLFYDLEMTPVHVKAYIASRRAKQAKRRDSARKSRTLRRSH